MRTAAALGALMMTALTGCAATMSDKGLDRADAALPPEAPAMVCNAAAAQGHIGKQATQTVGAAILKDAGARTLRWGPPGAMWTRDFRQDRVNVSYGADMTITEITCG